MNFSGCDPAIRFTHLRAARRYSLFHNHQVDSFWPSPIIAFQIDTFHDEVPMSNRSARPSRLLACTLLSIAIGGVAGLTSCSTPFASDSASQSRYGDSILARTISDGSFAPDLMRQP